MEPEGSPEPVPNVSDTVVATTTPPDVAQPQLLTQEYISISPEPAELPAVDEFADPKIAQLHAMFPDFDAVILYSVVDSVGEDQDRAVDALLSMSDPDHVSAVQPPAAQPPVTTQTQLDEEFARQLLLEDEERYARDRAARQQHQQQQQQLRQFPYAQRTSAVTVPPQQQQQQGRGSSPQSPPSQRERDTMSDVQDQFSKLAESGKRTFSTLVSKVKAKVQEFDQSRNAQNTSPTDASTSAVSPTHSASSPSGLDRHAQQAYYAPRLDPGLRRAEEPPPPAPPTDDPSTSAPSATSMNRSPSNTIDPGKIGLLPKRPMSLVDTQAQSQQQQLEQQHESSSQPPDDSEEEELEYIENPFEEGRHN